MSDKFKKGAGGDKAGTLKASTLKSKIHKKKKETQKKIWAVKKAKQEAIWKKYAEEKEGLTPFSPYRVKASDKWFKDFKESKDKWYKDFNESKDNWYKDYKLIEEYSKHAPKSRSFMTTRKKGDLKKPKNPKKSNTYSKKEVQKITGKTSDGTIKYKKAGGGQVKNRNMGGVIGGGLGSQDVVDYLYKYKS